MLTMTIARRAEGALAKVFEASTKPSRIPDDPARSANVFASTFSASAAVVLFVATTTSALATSMIDMLTGALPANSVSANACSPARRSAIEPWLVWRRVDHQHDVQRIGGGLQVDDGPVGAVLTNAPAVLGESRHRFSCPRRALRRRPSCFRPPDPGAPRPAVERPCRRRRRQRPSTSAKRVSTRDGHGIPPFLAASAGYLIGVLG